MTVVKALKAGQLLDEEEDLNPSPRALRREAIRSTNDINKLPTTEVIRRLYHRHDKRVWQLVAITTWVILIYNVIW